MSTSQTITAFDDIAEIDRQIERHRENGWTELAPEKKLFASAFLDCPTPVGAAKEAGISSATGAKYYKDPVVRAFIADLQEFSQQVSLVNNQYVTAMLLRMMPIFMGEEEAPIVVPGVGPMLGKKFYSTEALRCVEMLGKSVGFFNADLSGNQFLQAMQAMQDYGREHAKNDKPISPAAVRLAYENGESKTRNSAEGLKKEE